jgi:hypothetical protein
MQPVKLIIGGRFWDSQLYKGRLYLFELDGSLRLINWESLIAQLHVPDRCRLAMECAFLRSDYLYGNKWDRFYQDHEVKDLLASKFDELFRQTLHVDFAMLDRITEHRIETPFPYAHNDALCYKDYLYATSQSGVFAEDISNGIYQRSAEHLWDAPVSRLDVSLDILALAAGDAGLFRAPTVSYLDDAPGIRRGVHCVSNALCNDCSYVYSSILSIGYDRGASLLEFRVPERSEDEMQNSFTAASWEADPLRNVPGEELFGESTQGAFVWGSKDRLCMAKNGVLTVAKYLTNIRRRAVSRTIRSIQLDPWKGNPVSGNNAVFGAVLELDNCLVVVRSDDHVETLRGEPTNWRVFPRSRRYVNQLHVIYEDRLEVMSYNHDYFVDQSRKAFGEPHRERFSRRDERL